MHKHLIKKIIENGKHSDMEYLECLLDNFIHDLKTEYYIEYKSLEFDLYKMVYGEHINEELSSEWVSHMENKDGTHGGHWTIEQTSKYADHYNKYDWYAVMNMMYSDYYNPKYNDNDYIEMAKDWINDKDIEGGKTLKYYFYIVCNN